MKFILGIRTRLLIVAFVTLFALLVVRSVDFYTFSQTSKAQDIAYKVPLLVQKKSSELMLEEKYILTGDARLIRQLKDLNNASEGILAELRGMGLSPQSIALLDRIDIISEQHREMFRNAIALVAQLSEKRELLFDHTNEIQFRVEDLSESISMDLVKAMMEGTALYPARREFKNALYEFIGYEHIFVLNMHKLLLDSNETRFLSDELLYEDKVALVLRASRNLSRVTGNPSDKILWDEIEQTDEAIRAIRRDLHMIWRAQQDMKAELSASTAEIQSLLTNVSDNTFSYLSKTKSTGKTISLVTILVTLALISVMGSLILIDLSELKRAEGDLRQMNRRFSDVAMSTGEWIWETNRDGRYIYAGPMVQRVLGYSPDEVEGKRFHEFFPAEEREALQHVVNEIARRKETFSNFHSQQVRKDNEVVLIETTGVPVLDENGSLQGYRGAHRDVTERLRSEQTIRRSLQEKEVLLKEIHHRVKNNMAVISSLLSLQATRIEDERLMAMFNESQSRIMSMALVHEKLYQSEDFSTLSLPDYVETLAHHVRTAFGSSRSVAIITDIEDVSLDIDVLVPTGLIINELLTNAFKYAFKDEASPEIRIHLRRLVAGETLRLSVQDNGCGLPDNFDLITSGGLGLKLVRTLIKQVNGMLEVVPPEPPQHGTCFVLTFAEKILYARHGSLSD